MVMPCAPPDLAWVAVAFSAFTVLAGWVGRWLLSRGGRRARDRAVGRGIARRDLAGASVLSRK
jgi:hypothetical protein